MNPNDPKDLERLIHQTLRELPPRPAPTSLEARVRAEIDRRATLPWWRKSFVHWPLPARAVFLVVIAGIVKLALMGSVWVMAGFDGAEFRAAFAPTVRWMDAGLALVKTASDFVGVLLGSVPTVWLYGAAAAIAALYIALFGLGAAAYRTLYTNR